MTTRTLLPYLTAALLAIWGCADDPAANTTAPDAGAGGDMTSAMPDSMDMATAAPEEMGAGDLGADDGSAPADMGDGGATGFGALMGSCGEIDGEEIDSPMPFVFRNSLDFGDDPFDQADAPRLTEGGRTVLNTDNAGGSSILSEVFAFEVLARCEGAILLETETTVDYIDPMGKLTDLLVEIDGRKVAVSVVRAQYYDAGMLSDAYPAAEAERVLTKKLEGIAGSNENVEGDDVWAKQFLHALAYGEAHAQQLEDTWHTLDASLRGETVLVITVTHGDDLFIYTNQ